jgi:hypothetical protein
MTKKNLPKSDSLNSKEFLNLSLLLAMICFPGGCGTNAGNPFLETEAEDSPGAQRSPTEEGIPPPVVTTGTPPGKGGGPIIADCQAASSMESRSDAAGCTSKTPEGVTAGGNPVDVAGGIANGTGAPGPGGETQGPPGVGAKPTAQTEIPGISKSRSEIIAELKMSTISCSLVGVASSNKGYLTSDSGAQDKATSGLDFSSANSLFPGPVLSISLADGFKKSSIAVIAVSAAEGPSILENGSRLSAGKDFTIGVYDDNALICVHRGTLELSQTTASQIIILLNTPTANSAVK